jgi:hypothetical protein
LSRAGDLAAGLLGGLGLGLAPRATASNAGAMSAIFLTRSRTPAMSAPPSGPQGPEMYIERGWSQSMPLARTMLSSSQRCSSKRFICGSPRLSMIGCGMRSMKSSLYVRSLQTLRPA